VDAERPAAPVVSRSEKILLFGFIAVILSALVLIALFTIRGSNYSKNQALIQLLQDACKAYFVEYGTYPEQDADLGTSTLVKRLAAPRMTTLPDGSKRTSPGIVRFNAGDLSGAGQVLDSFGQPFRYRNPGVRNPRGIDVESAGKNGRFGDDDDLFSGR
jgi:hypothetical protein